jgi:hypothetical protein
VLKSCNKVFEFTQTRLRSAKDIFNQGGHVIPLLKDPSFSLLYDNRRQIIEPSGFKGYDLSNTLLDSVPLINAKTCKRLRFFSKFYFNLPYNKTFVNKKTSVYKIILR